MAWDLLEENFNDLTDWTDSDGGSAVSEISPAGQLHQSSPTTSDYARIRQDIGTIGSGDFTIFTRFKIDTNGLTNTSAARWIIEGATNWVGLYFNNTRAEIYSGSGYNTVITQTWDKDTWYTVRMIVHNSQTDVDVYLDEDLKTSDADCTAGHYMGDGTVEILQNGNLLGTGQVLHMDYFYIGAGQQVPSTTSIKKVSGVEHASIKKIGGVAIGDVKKIAGVE